jgi:gamma-glutamylcyclotransferase (GGCT)/AIG2-like uncharacterized protein YtfP
MKKIVLYVYGTLRPGIKHQEERVPGLMYNLGWYPGAVLDETAETSFVCERVEIKPEALKGFDSYEGFNDKFPESSLFVRTPYKDGFIYQYNRDVSPYSVIEGGDWLEHTDRNMGVSANMVLLAQ